MIGLFFLAVALVIVGVIWTTGPVGRLIGYGLIAATILTDVAAWGAAKLFAGSMRRDEIAGNVRTVLLREADFAGSPPYHPASDPFRYLRLLDHGVLDRFIYQPVADKDLGVNGWLRAGTTYEVRRIADPVCQGRDLFFYYALAKKTCFSVRPTEERQAVKAVPLAYDGPLSWPVRTVSYVAIQAPDGRIRARACVAYRGGVWNWLDDHLFSRWTANGPSHSPVRTTLESTCDSGSGEEDNVQHLFN